MASNAFMQVGAPVPDEILDLSLAGTNLRGATLRDEIGGEPTLLVFLRHFG